MLHWKIYTLADADIETHIIYFGRKEDALRIYFHLTKLRSNTIIIYLRKQLRYIETQYPSL